MKKGFISSPLVFIFSALLFLLASIIFYFVFKFSAQSHNVAIGAQMSAYSFLPTLTMLRTPSQEYTLAEDLVNGDYAGKISPLYPEYYWELVVCPSAALITSKSKVSQCAYTGGNILFSKTASTAKGKTFVIQSVQIAGRLIELNDVTLPVQLPGSTYIHFFADVPPEELHEP